MATSVTLVPAEGILKIDYNYLNLPDYVKFDKTYLPRDLNPGALDYNVNTRYLYNAEGVKLRKVYTYGSGRGQMEPVEKTDYLDGFQYTNDKLSFVPTSEGYFDFVQNKYIYNYTDQVGNIRLAYYKDTSGNPKIDRVTDYYPFGLEFGDYLGTSLSISPNYKYSSQGQEKQTETGWSSYKWRNYDSAMGRFFNIDPLSEKYMTWSPYAFSGNRVIDARELEGLELHVLFNTRENAAANFGEQYNGKSILDKREIGALIYFKYVEGKKYYAYNNPTTGEAHGIPQGLNMKLPKGAAASAFIHAHGNEDKEYDDENFSGDPSGGGDKGVANNLGLDAFLVTPGGQLKYYDLSSKNRKNIKNKYAKRSYFTGKKE